jgi:hypothetical protein
MCANGCIIATTFYASGTVNSANRCQICQPSVSINAWSNNDGASCATGVCSGGTCSAACTIGGTVYQSQQHNAAEGCQICDPTKSTTAWSTLPTGTLCSDSIVPSGVCDPTTCENVCYIAHTFYSAGQTHSTNSCEICDPARSRTDWSANNGASCGVGRVCSNRTCPGSPIDGGACGQTADPCTVFSDCCSGVCVPQLQVCF